MVPVNILNLPGWEVTGHTRTPTECRIEATYTRVPTACPACRSLFDRLHRHGKRVQEVRDRPVDGRPVVVVLTRNRYRCRGCGRTVLPPLPDVDERSQMTRRLAEWVGEQSVARTFTAVAAETGLTNVTVRNAFAAYLARLDREHKFLAPPHLGIGEIRLLKRPRCVLTDRSRRAVLGVLPGRDEATVTAALRALHRHTTVRVVVIGMCRGHLAAASAVLPQAAVVVDRSHVVRTADDAVEVVWNDILTGLEPRQQARMKRDRAWLRRREADLTPAQHEKLASWVTAYPTLGQAHRLKERFHAIWEVPQKADAQQAYRAWAASIRGVRMTAAYRPLLTAMAEWHAPIFAGWDHPVAHTVTEALSRVAELAGRTGRGYRFDVIRARLLYHYRHLDVNPEPVGRPAEPPDQGGILRPGVDIDRLLAALEADGQKWRGSGGRSGSAQPEAGVPARAGHD